MEPLEQELHDIKLGRLSVEKYRGAKYKHPQFGQEDPIVFFKRVYAKFWSEPKDDKYMGLIYQDDLMLIDLKLFHALDSKIRDIKKHFNDYLPSRKKRVSKIKETGYKKTDVKGTTPFIYKLAAI